MTAQREHPDGEEARIDDSSPEEYNNVREARKLFIGVILTPIYWFVMFSIISWWMGSNAFDSAWVSILWGVMGLIFTVSMTFAGAQQARVIRGSEDQRGLLYARGTVIVGALFTIATVVITVALLTD